MNESIAQFWGLYRERNFFKTLEDARRPLPEIPKGNQRFVFSVGDTVKSSGVGPLKAGVSVKIVDRYEQHGYCYYVGDNGMVHREKDLARL